MSTTPLRTLLLPIALAACVPPPTGGPPVDTDTGAPPAVEPDDTGFPPGDKASVMLTRIQQEDGTQLIELQGLVVDNNQGYYNVAHCAVTGGTCLPVLPPLEDDYVTIDPAVVFQPELSQYGYVGLDVTLGPWRAHYVNGGETPFPYYYSDLTPKYGTESVFGWYGIRLDGTWGKYRGEHDIYVSPELELITPEPHSKIEFNDTDELVFQWVPDGNGVLFLYVLEDGIGANVTRMYMLEDDGYFQLPVRDLGFGTSEETVNFVLSRWNMNTLNIRGNTLDVVATSEVPFTGEYFFVDGRDPVLDGDTCEEAAVLPGIQTGRYWGSLEGYKNNYGSGGTVGFTCNTGHDNGVDAVVPVDLAPRQAVLASHRLPNDDAVLGILKDCNITGGSSCLGRSDVGNPYLGGPETLSYFNATDEDQRVYLIIDDWSSPTEGNYELDVEIQQLVEPPMHDVCVDAMGEPTPVGTGTYLYYTNFLAYTPGTDPGSNGCTGKAEPGTDSMMKVQVLAGQTLSAKINMEGSDPALYLVYQCNNPATCAAGVDAHINQPGETLVYQNSTGQTENMFLVVDTKSGNGLMPYTLTLDIH